MNIWDLEVCPFCKEVVSIVFSPLGESLYQRFHCTCTFILCLLHVLYLIVRSKALTNGDNALKQAEHSPQCSIRNKTL